MADLNSLRNLLESRGYFNVGFNEFPFTDSINSTSTYYIRRRISERIAASDIVLGIAGIYVSYSDCMKWKFDKVIEKKNTNGRSNSKRSSKDFFYCKL